MRRSAVSGGSRLTSHSADFAAEELWISTSGRARPYLVDGLSVAEGRVAKTQPNIFPADETADVGIDNQTPVAQGIGIGAETRFTGRINKIALEVSPVE